MYTLSREADVMGRKARRPMHEDQSIAREMRRLGAFVASDQQQCSFPGCSGRCRYAIHRTCERLGLDHQSEDFPTRCEITRERYLDTVLTVRKPAGWRMGDRPLDSYREDLHPAPENAPRPRRKRYECECCGKGDDEIQIALTRNWGLGCVDCIEDGSFSEMVGEDINAYTRSRTCRAATSSRTTELAAEAQLSARQHLNDLGACRETTDGS